MRVARLLPKTALDGAAEVDEIVGDDAQPRPTQRCREWRPGWIPNMATGVAAARTDVGNVMTGLTAVLPKQSN